MGDSNQPQTWRDKFLESSDGQHYDYLIAWHWALSHFFSAPMEVHPVNARERLFACFVILFALVIFSTFVSSITHAMTHLRMVHARQIEQNMFITRYFREFGIPRVLAARCRHFLQQHQRMALKRIKASDIPCREVLPKCVVEDVRVEALLPWLKAHPFFDFYSAICPVGMRQVCCRAIEEVSMLPEEEIYWSGQPVNRMFFVRAGSVSYIVEDPDMPLFKVREGQWACEETLWSKVSLLDAPFTASTFGCELIMLLPAEFQAITMLHADTVAFCISYAKVFIEAFNSASKDTACQNLLFNSYNSGLQLVFDACARMEAPGEIFGSGSLNARIRPKFDAKKQSLKQSRRPSQLSLR